jgi:hypothetical protein
MTNHAHILSTCAIDVCISEAISKMSQDLLYAANLNSRSPSSSLNGIFTGEMDDSLQKAKPDRPPRTRAFTLLNFPKGTLFNRVNLRYTTAAFTLSPEPWALLCCANLSGDYALYAISVRRRVRGRLGS